MKSGYQGDTSYPQVGIMSEKNIESSISNQNIPYGQINDGQTNDIVPPKTVLRSDTIDLILECIDVLECCINNSAVNGNKVQLSMKSICKCLSNCNFTYDGNAVDVNDSTFLCCGLLLEETADYILKDFGFVYDAEVQEVCGSLAGLRRDVFSDDNNELNNKGVIPFSDFPKVVDAAFKLYSFSKKHGIPIDNVSNEHITDGYVYTFLSYLRDIFISVYSALIVKKNEKDISTEIICRNIKSYIFNHGKRLILFDLLRFTMLKYYYFHKELVRICGEKVIEGEFDFHSSFTNLIAALCYVYNIFEKVKINKEKINSEVIHNLLTFTINVQCIKNDIEGIFKFFISNSDFLKEQKKVIEKSKIESVVIEKSYIESPENEMFLGLVENIKQKGMYENIEKIKPEYFNNNYNHLSMNYINNDNTSFAKEDNVKKPLGEIIDNVMSNRSSCCCSCQVRSR